MELSLTEGQVCGWMPRRDPQGHKGTFGKVDILAGCEGFTGAPVLAATAAVHGGTGLVFLQVPRSIYPIVAVKCDEAMPSPLPDQGGQCAQEAYDRILAKMSTCDAGLIGPGLGRSEALDRLIPQLLTALSIPLVLDADGLNALSGHIDTLSTRHAPTILTPHDGEFQRLTGHWPGTDRPAEARSLAERCGCVVVLKGHCTVIAGPDSTCYINTTGNAGMAKGGSGDVLAGLMVSFLAQGMAPMEAAGAAVWVHGRAGDLCKQRFGERYMAPTDLIRMLAPVLKQLEEQHPPNQT